MIEYQKILDKNMLGVLKDIYEEEFQRAASEDGERTSLRLVPSYSSLRVT